MPKRAAKKGKAPNDFLKKGKDEQRPLPFQKKGDETRKPAKRSRVCHATAHTKEGRDKTGVRRALHEVECGQGISHTQKQRLAVAYQQYRGKRNKRTPDNHETDCRGFVDGGGHLGRWR